MSEYLLVNGVIGLALIGLGGLIWKFEWIHLLNNFRYRAIRDRAGLARWAGIFSMLIGGLLIGFGWVMDSAHQERTQQLLAFGMVMLMVISLGIYLKGGQRFVEK